MSKLAAKDKILLCLLVWSHKVLVATISRFEFSYEIEIILNLFEKLLEFGEIFKILFLSSFRKRHLVRKNRNRGHLELFGPGMPGPHTIGDFYFTCFRVEQQ